MAYVKPSAYANSIWRIDANQNLSSSQNKNSAECYNLARLDGYNPDNAYPLSAWLLNEGSQKIFGTGSASDPYHWIIGNGSGSGNLRSRIQLIRNSGVGINPGSNFSVACFVEINQEMGDNFKSYANPLSFYYNEGHFTFGWDGAGRGFSFQRVVNSSWITYADPLRQLSNSKFLFVVNHNYTEGYIQLWVNGMPLGKNTINEGELDNPTGNMYITCSGAPQVSYKLFYHELFNKCLSFEEIHDIATNICGMEFNIDPINEEPSAASIVVTNEVIKHIDTPLFAANFDYLSDRVVVGSSTVWNDDDLAKEYANAIHSIGTTDLRYAGGHDVALTWWDLSKEIEAGTKSKSYFGTIYNNSDLYIEDLQQISWIDSTMLKVPTHHEMFRFCKKYNLKLNLQLNFHTWWDKEENLFRLMKPDPYINSVRQWGTGEVNWTKVDEMCDELRDMLQYMKLNGYAHIISRIELDNEDYGEDNYSWECKYTGTEYAELACRVIDVIASEMPDKKVVLTGYVHYDKYELSKTKIFTQTEISIFTQELLNYAPLKDRKDSIIAISHHHYNIDDGVSTTDEDFLISTWVKDSWGAAKPVSAYADYLDSIGWNDLLISVNETNNAAGLGSISPYCNSQNHTYMACLRLFQNFIGTANSPRILNTMWHNINHETSSKKNFWGYGLLHFAKNLAAGKRFQPHMEGYMHRIMNSVTINKDILTSSTDNNEVPVFVSRNGNKAHVFIASLKNEHTVSVDLTELGNILVKKAKRIIFPLNYGMIPLDSSVHYTSQPTKVIKLKNKYGVVNTDNVLTFSANANEVIIIDLEILEGD